MLLVQRRIAKEAFLEVFRECGVIRPALEAAGVTRATLSSWLEHDVEFTVRYHEAEKDAVDFLEMVALKRACGGKLPSDRLLITLLRARDPARFRESVTISPQDGLSVTYTNDWRPRPDDEPAPSPVSDDVSESSPAS